MAATDNKVSLVGNLWADPEWGSLKKGRQVVNRLVATTENWKDACGQRQERTEWHRVVIFNEGLGKVASGYLRKGSKVYLEGQIQTRKWTDQSGAEKFSTEIVRSEEHTSELQSLMRISYAVFCLKKKKNTDTYVHVIINYNHH